MHKHRVIVQGNVRKGKSRYDDLASPCSRFDGDLGEPCVKCNRLQGVHPQKPVGIRKPVKNGTRGIAPVATS